MSGLRPYQVGALDAVRQQLALGREDVRPVPGYESDYAVTRDGRVFSLNYRRAGVARELRPELMRKGYLRVALYGADGSRRKVMIHRLVAAAFIPNPLGLSQVNHKDGNKAKNAANNLEWCDCADNIRHAVSIGLHTRGERHASAILAESQVRQIKAALRNNRRGLRAQLARQYGVSFCTIDSIASGKTWRHVHV